MSVTSGSHTQERVIRTGLDKLERNLHTAQPGIVVSYDAATQTANVRPAVRRALPSALDEDLDVMESLPVCMHVPVAWPRGQGFSIIGTLSPGDTVLLVFCERDFAGWYETGDVSDPQFAELHALNGAVAIPGFTPRTKPTPPTDAAVLASTLHAQLVLIKTALDTIAGAVPVANPYVVPAEATLRSTILKLGA